MHKFDSLFRLTQALPISNLQRRVEYQRKALEQAESDLAEARQAQGLDPEDEELDAPSPYISDEHQRIRAADERRRRGLGPIHETNVREASAAIIRADRRRQGLEPCEPVSARLPTESATAEQIIAAYRKAKGIKT